MRPWTIAVLVAATGLAAFAFAAEDEREAADVERRGAFLNALASGDRISIPQREAAEFSPRGHGGTADGFFIDVLTEEEIRELSLKPEELSELKKFREEESDVGSKRHRELEGRVIRHPMEIIEVGTDYVAYRMWNGRVTYLPEREIRAIHRPSLKQK